MRQTNSGKQKAEIAQGKRWGHGRRDGGGRRLRTLQRAAMRGSDRLKRDAFGMGEAGNARFLNWALKSGLKGNRVCQWLLFRWIVRSWWENGKLQMANRAREGVKA